MKTTKLILLLAAVLSACAPAVTLAPPTANPTQTPDPVVAEIEDI